jgi:hypothetical protein
LKADRDVQHLAGIGRAELPREAEDGQRLLSRNRLVSSAIAKRRARSNERKEGENRNTCTKPQSDLAANEGSNISHRTASNYLVELEDV